MRRGKINRGLVKVTKNQQKKHYTQFSLEEKEYLVSALRNIDTSKIIPSKHLASKLDVTYKMEDIQEVLKDNNLKDMIIEYNVTITREGVDKRVLLRSKKSFPVIIKNNTVDCNICFVISIINNEIITVYYNKQDDNHNTVDFNRYNKNLKIIG